MQLRRAFFGYRRSDVDAALAERHRQVTALARSLDHVWRDRDHVRERFDAERSALQAELDAERGKQRRVDRVAQMVALHIIGRAEKDAAQIRDEAAARESQASQRVVELLEVRERLLDEFRAKVVALADALERPDRRAPARPALTAVRGTARDASAMVSDLTALARAAHTA